MDSPFSGLRFGWIALGWFIAAALTSLVLLALAGLGLLEAEPSAGGPWVGLAMLVGFGGAGFALGVRVGERPIVHGVALALFSLLVWVAVNLLLGEPTDQTAWNAISTPTAAGLLVLQAAAAVVGARAGVRWMRSRL